jgi:hypothetical protein
MNHGGLRPKTSARETVASTRREWGFLMDRLCVRLTSAEEAQIRDMAAACGIPHQLVPLHDWIARLLVKYGIITWWRLRTEFNGELRPSRASISINTP